MVSIKTVLQTLMMSKNALLGICENEPITSLLAMHVWFGSAGCAGAEVAR